MQRLLPLMLVLGLAAVIQSASHAPVAEPSAAPADFRDGEAGVDSSPSSDGGEKLPIDREAIEQELRLRCFHESLFGNPTEIAGFHV